MCMSTVVSHMKVFLETASGNSPVQGCFFSNISFSVGDFYVISRVNLNSHSSKHKVGDLISHGKFLTSLSHRAFS